MKLFYVNDIQNALGIIIPAGSTIQLTLSQNTTTGSYPLTKTPIVIPIDNTGSASQNIWFNDEQLPLNTFYNVQIVTPDYGAVYNQNIPITGASFNLGAFVPGSTGSVVTSIVIPTLQTNSVVNTDQLLLNLIAGSNITITSDTDGDVTISGQASGVTSVGLVDSTGFFTVTGSPVTTTGNLTLSAFASQTQNTFLAAPNGSNGAPTWRTILAADIPTLNQNTTGTSGGLTGTPNITVGTVAGTVITASTGFAITGATTAGHYLRNNGTDYVDSAIQASDVPTLNQNTSGTAANLSGTPALPNGTTATTQAAGDDSTQLATTAYVATAASAAQLPFVATTGTGAAYVATFSPAITALTPGLMISILPNVANTSTTPTLNVNGLGAKTIKRLGTGNSSTINDYNQCDITTSAILYLVYDGTYWQLTNPQSVFVCKAGQAGVGTHQVAIGDNYNGLYSTGVFTDDSTTLTYQGTGGLNIGKAGTASGVITLDGSTSGSCTITAPAVAGTAANAIAVSNTINIPSGTSFSINGDAFLSRQGSGAFRVGTTVGGIDGEIAGATGYFSTVTSSGYFSSLTANPAASGLVRLANTDKIAWRNAGNTADLSLGWDSSNNLLLPQYVGRDVTGGAYVNFSTTDIILNTYGGDFISIPNNGVKLGSSQVLSWNGDTGISRDSAGTFDFGNGTAGNKLGQINANGLTLTGEVIFGGVVYIHSGQVLTWNSDVGISRDSAGVLDVGNGTQGDKSGTVNATTANITGTATVGTLAATTINAPGSTGQVPYNNGGVLAGSPDLVYNSSGNRYTISGNYGSNAALQVGNTSAGRTINFNSTGSTYCDNVGDFWLAGTLSKYNGINTVGVGVPSLIAQTNLTAQTAAITTTTLYAVPSGGAGQYCLSWDAKVTTAATTGSATSTLGALTVTYVDPDGTTQTITCGAQSHSGTIETSDAGNSTTTVLLGLPILINSASSQNITYAMAYASNTANQMAYNLHIRLESM